MEKIDKLQEWIDSAEKIVFFGGAGVSTESGIKDFRSVDGLYNEKYDYPPEVILSHSFFISKTAEFYKFYRDKLDTREVMPNVTHEYLRRLETRGKDITIVTQNIDGLHEKVGSEKVLLLHGTISKNHCMNCGKEYDASYVFKNGDIPKCECEGIIKPDVILYEEALNEDIIKQSIKAIKECDLLIVAGTSLTVYPAASFINYYHGNKMVIINRDGTPYDRHADLVINDKLGNIFTLLK